MYSKQCKQWWATIRRVLTLETRLAPFQLLGPLIIVLFAITIFPTVYAIWASTLYWHLDVSAKHFVGIANFQHMFYDLRFWNAFKNTAIFTVGSLICELVLGMAIALLMVNSHFGSRLSKSLILIPMLSTPVVVGLMWVLLYDPQFGLLNYLFNLVGLPRQSWLASEHYALVALIVIDIWEWTPFVVLILMAGLQSLPSDIYEAARCDGAGAWQAFRNVTLPLMKPFISIALVFRFMDAFRWFDTIYVVTKGGPGIATENWSMYGYLTGFSYLNMGYSAAMGVVMLIVIIAISQLIIKRLFTGYNN
ncbi:trehalose transport system permease protein SugA [Peptococcaceae bacterium CEB3]|nr:trehalose transport system permease protein SugA [Peptococcaceae bacterium CEB3]